MAALFDNIPKNPTIQSNRLIINDIQKADGDAFLRLSNDTQNNRLWGYDCRTDKDYAPTEAYFLNFVRRMKETGEEYSLAIRYKGKFCGEAVFHGFDEKGTVEIGIRLLPDFQGLGLGAEATAAMADFAKKVLGAKKIVMKCFLENLPSQRMIERAGFTKTHQDDTYFYFQY